MHPLDAKQADRGLVVSHRHDQERRIVEQPRLVRRDGDGAAANLGLVDRAHTDHLRLGRSKHLAERAPLARHGVSRERAVGVPAGCQEAQRFLFRLMMEDEHAPAAQDLARSHEQLIGQLVEAEIRRHSQLPLELGLVTAKPREGAMRSDRRQHQRLQGAQRVHVPVRGLAARPQQQQCARRLAHRQRNDHVDGFAEGSQRVGNVAGDRITRAERRVAWDRQERLAWSLTWVVV
ncbi:MAG: hypothetical protein U1E76_01870 [Planctomycetota bacterium]